METFNLYDQSFFIPDDEITFLFNAYHVGDYYAREKIIRYYMPLVYSIAQKYFGGDNYDDNELVSVGFLGLLRAVDYFDVSRIFKFETYATKCIEKEILTFLKKVQKWEYSEELVYKQERNDLEENYFHKETLDVLALLVNDLPSREREIIKMYFGFYDDKCFSQEEISFSLGVSQSCVSKVIKKTLKELGEFLEKDGLIVRKK